MTDVKKPKYCETRSPPRPCWPKYAEFTRGTERDSVPSLLTSLQDQKNLKRGSDRGLKGRLTSRYFGESSCATVRLLAHLWERVGWSYTNSHCSEKGFQRPPGEHWEAERMLSSWKTQKQGQGWLSCFVGRARTVSDVVLRTVQEFVVSKDAWVFPMQMWTTLQR